MEVRKIKAMTSAEIADTSKRVQMWLAVIAKNESIQRLGDEKEVMHFVEREKQDRGFVSAMDLVCIRHAIEVCPVKCNLTKKYHEQWK